MQKKQYMIMEFIQKAIILDVGYTQVMEEDMEHLMFLEQ